MSVRQPAGATSDGLVADVCALEADVLLGVALCVTEADGEAELLTGLALLILALTLALALCETSAEAA